MTGRSRHLLVRVWTALSTFAVFSLLPGTVAQSPAERLDRFYLFNNCQPMYLLVEGLPPDALETGLSQESIQAAVESRMRSARIYTSDQSALAYLYVNLNISNLAFNLRLEFKKWVYDFASDSELTASTWSAAATGMHGNDSSYLLSVLSQHMDQFLVEYLRVNESACE